MILVILAIFIAITVVGAIADAKRSYSISGALVAIFGAVGGIVALVAAIILGITTRELIVIDDRIEMYQEENAQIEQQIADVVEQYQKYETDIFMEVAPESAVSMVALYPELKSDSLVQAQIEVYVANNNMIKDLKDQQIKGDVYRWWLYFGGGGD